MKFVNKTKYDGRELRAFITWVSNQEDWTPAMRKRLSVEVVPSQKWHTGTAWSGLYHIEILIPKPDRLKKVKFASLVAHELRHLTNKEHTKWKTERWMRGSGRYGFKNCERFWSEAEKLSLSYKTTEPKPKDTPMDKAEVGLKHAQAKVAEMERQIRLATNRLKKWQKKARYYEKRVAHLEANPSVPKEHKPRKVSEATLVRRAINAHITKELRGEDRQQWEVYSMIGKSIQASGLRGSFDEEWEGDFVALKDARKIVNPGESMLLRGYRQEEFYGECEIEIPGIDELLGPQAMAAQVEKDSES